MITDICGFPTLVRQFQFSDSSIEAIRHEIWEAIQLVETTGSIYYPGQDASKTLVIFAGHMEKFATLSLARFTWCNVLIIQDFWSPWYQGSSILPPIEMIGEDLLEKLDGQKVVFFGQSSGAYAALAASKRFRDAAVMAVSPQTFSDGAIKDAIQFGRNITPARTPDGLIDLYEYLGDADTSTKRQIICSASEYKNPIASHFWMDHLHVFRMIPLSCVEIAVIRCYRHSAVFQNAETYSKLIYALVHSGDPWESIISTFVSYISDHGNFD